MLLSMATLLSCRVNNNGVQTGKHVIDFMKLKIGNYWVYETWVRPTDTTETRYGTDSIFVASDTLLDDRRYFVLKISQNGSRPAIYRLLRDSAHYVLDRHQGIIFSSQDFGVVFDTSYIASTDTVATITTMMVDSDFVSNYPAGIFSTYTFRERYKIHPPFDTVLTDHDRDMRYARNVGMVFETYGYYVQTKSYMERRLARYSVR